MMDDVLTVLPNASSLIESMRSIGYSFETAIADIIDNSISGDAKQVDIFLNSSDGQPYIQIIDNGFGMNNEELIEAMRLGSKNPTEERLKSDLGRFGLGLKSASFSQCRVLTVISKKDKQINGYQWDLDLVQRTDKFSIRKLRKNEIEEISNINILYQFSHGTIVQWQNFDRISSASQNLEDELDELMNNTIDHIGLIFHRFIEDNLSIRVNHEAIYPKDPFLRNHAGTQELQRKKIKIEEEYIYLYPFVLPHYSKLTNEDKRKSGKIKEQYKAQGLYLYRNKRLIVWGNYLGLSRRSELGKNARIRVDIPNTLDYIWEIDVKKSSATVPSIIKKNLLSVISDGEIISKKVNTFKGKKEFRIDKPLWQYHSSREEEFYFSINQENELYKQFVKLLDENQRKIFAVFLRSLEDNIPTQAIYSQISDGKKLQVTEDTELTILFHEQLKVMKSLSGININSWLKAVILEEPYASNKAILKLVGEELEHL